MPLAFLLILIPCLNFWSAENKKKPRKVENMKILPITLQNCGNIIKEIIKCWRPAQMAVGLVVLIWGYNVCNALLPSFSQVWAVSFSITLFLHLCLHLSDHVLHSPQLKNTNSVTRWPTLSNISVTSIQLVFGLRDHTSASFSSKIISLSISSGSGAFLHDNQV